MRPISLFVLCATAVIAGSEARAGAFEEMLLRGSTVAASYGGDAPRHVPSARIYYRWEGLYAGGHFGYSGAGVDFGNGTQSLIDYLLRNDVVGTHVSNWTTLSKTDTSKTVYGGFIGYNVQQDDLVFGAEGNYNRVISGGMVAAASDSMTRTFSDDTAAPAGHHYFYTATVTSLASARIRDFGTIRVRAGVALDMFLPYVFFGGAVGRADTIRSATISYRRRDIPDNVVPPAPPITPEPDFNFGPQTRAETREGVFAYGYTAGLGIDIALMPNVFMRAEWEYIQFLPVQDFRIHMNTVRAGVGVKF